MKDFLVRHYHIVVLILVFILVGIAYYIGLEQGRVKGGEPVVLACSDAVLKELTIPTALLAQSARAPAVTPAASGSSQGKYVGSKNGTKYYLPNCGTVKRIKPENYVWFRDETDAQIQGYSPGKC